MTTNKLRAVFCIIILSTLILSAVFTFVFNNGSIMFGGIVAMIVEALLCEMFDKAIKSSK